MSEHEVGEKGFWWKKLCDLQSPLSFHYPPRLPGMECGGQKKILLHPKAEVMKHDPWKWPFGGPGNPQRDTAWTDHTILWWGGEGGCHKRTICVYMGLRWETPPHPFFSSRASTSPKALPTMLDNEEEDARRFSSCMTMILLKGWAVGFFFLFTSLLEITSICWLDYSIRLLLYIEKAFPTIFRR